MAPVQPSPYQFLRGRGQQQATTGPHSESSARQADAARRSNAQQSVPTAATPSPFAPTPRFSAGRAVTPANQTHPPSPERQNFVHTLRATQLPREDVEEAETADSQDDEMLEAERSEMPPPSRDLPRVTDSHKWTEILPHSPKRRRLTQDGDDEHCLSTAIAPLHRPTFKPPTLPPSTPATVPFVRNPAVLSDATDSLGSLRRPAFLPPSTAPAEPSEPLPEIFSPHRRGQKFAPGGMAATLQQWIIETGQAAMHSRRGQAYLEGDAFVLRVKLDELLPRHQGPFLARATRSDGGSVNVLFMVSPDASGHVETTVAKGNVVGIRAPVLNVELDTEVWAVAVDWKILS